jgi:hypothetical protein
MDGTPQSDHRQAWDLIPWVVNGSASEAQRRLVMAHSAGCADCREEFEFQRRLHLGMGDGAPLAADGPAEPPPTIELALQRFWARVDAEQAVDPWTQLDEQGGPKPHLPRLPRAPLRPPRTSRSGWQRALVAAVVLQAIGLAAALGVIWERPARADYQALSLPTAAAPGASIRLVPAPGLQLGELRALLARSDLQLLQSNPDATILSLGPRPGARFGTPEALQRLRAEPGVLLAEPITPAAGR